MVRRAGLAARVPLDFLIRADIAWYETWRKYSLPPFEGYGPMGSPGIAVYGNTASVDMGYRDRTSRGPGSFYSKTRMSAKYKKLGLNP